MIRPESLRVTLPGIVCLGILASLPMVFSAPGLEKASADPGESLKAESPETALSQTLREANSPVSITGHGVAEVLPGARFELRFDAEIEPGWHIYSIGLSPELGTPTRVEARDLGPFERAGAVTESKPHERFDANFGATFQEHEGEATFRLPLNAPKDVFGGRHPVKVDFVYQVCNAQMCLPPMTHTFELPVTVLGSGAPVTLTQTRQADGHPMVVTGHGVSGISSGELFVLKLVADIEKGWHIYSVHYDGAAAIPTEITIPSAGPFVPEGEIREPTPHQKKDELLDETLSYHEGRVTFEIPLRAPKELANGVYPVKLEVLYQICDANMCLPQETLAFELPVMVGETRGGLPDSVLTQVRQVADAPVRVTGKGAGPLEPGAEFYLELSAEIEPGWHIYGMALSEELGTATEVEVTSLGPFTANGVVQEPTPHERFDANLGANVLEHEGTAVFKVPLKVPPEITTGRHAVKVRFRYQVCTTEMCLTDETLSFELPVFVGNVGSTVAGPEDNETTTATQAPRPGETGPVRFAMTVAEAEVARGDTFVVDLVGSVKESGAYIPAFRWEGFEGIGAVIWQSIIGALIALLTPCVYPMIPITVSVFTKQAHQKRAAVFGLAVIFCLGIVITFTALGLLLSVAIGESGANWFASHWLVNLFIGGLFLYFAFSLMGYYEIALPTWLTMRVTSLGSGGGVMSVITMGFVFSVTTFTCVGPIVSSLLALSVSGGGSAFNAAIGMLVFSATFSLPFFVLALFPKALASMPKSGGWLNSVKVVLGLLEFAAAWKFLSMVPFFFGINLLPREVVLGIWVLTFVATILYLLGKIRFPHDSPLQGVGVPRLAVVLIFVALSVYCGYGATGVTLHRDLDAQLADSMFVAEASEDAETIFSEETKLDFDAELAKAAARGRPVFVDFTGWI